MDIENLYREDTDFNICKSWLCGSTDGQTYAINNYFCKKIRIPAGMSEDEFRDKSYDFFVSDKWEDAIGYKHDYKIDDPAVDEEAKRMVRELNALIDRLSADPDYRHWDRDGVWLLECKLDGKEDFTFKYRGKKSNACRFSADLVISELGDGDGENGGKGSLKNCIGGIVYCFMTGATYHYANYVFSFREMTEEV